MEVTPDPRHIESIRAANVVVGGSQVVIIDGQPISIPSRDELLAYTAAVEKAYDRWADRAPEPAPLGEQLTLPLMVRLAAYHPAQPSLIPLLCAAFNQHSETKPGDSSLVLLLWAKNVRFVLLLDGINEFRREALRPGAARCAPCWQTAPAPPCTSPAARPTSTCMPKPTRRPRCCPGRGAGRGRHPAARRGGSAGDGAGAGCDAQAGAGQGQECRRYTRGRHSGRAGRISSPAPPPPWSSAFGTPLLSGIAGPVTQFVLDQFKRRGA